MTPRSAATLSAAVLLLGLMSCSGAKSKPKHLPPIIFVPGYGMGALQVEVERQGRPAAKFDFLLPAMNPDAVFAELRPPAANALDYARQRGLDAADVGFVRDWLKLDIDAKGSAQNRPGVHVRPVSIGENFSHECPRYSGMVDILASVGWEPNRNLDCIPFDYRYPPGETNFAEDLKNLIVSRVEQTNGTKVTLACHSQGCLLAYHFLRTADPVWVAEHIGLFFSLAGQFSGCSDCLRWAFQKQWNWDSENKVVSPSDMTWVGELALGLQRSVYGEEVLYRWGQRSYRAIDVVSLLREAGALEIARATDRYALDKQTWFQKGARDHEPLPVPTRVVFGTDLATTAGFSFSREQASDPNCKTPQCGGLYSQDDPELIQTSGDQGDSRWMNQAPRVWLKDPQCEMKEFAFVGHMDIFENIEVLSYLTETVRQIASGNDPCAEVLTLKGSPKKSSRAPANDDVVKVMVASQPGKNDGEYGHRRLWTS